ncbi:hypothetical protein ACUWEX_11070 [Okibacterium fritillariae]|uniref:hypothetical protein n=1 Tax=Okibacterium fritillariae TaxID=123320 RepID=UPI004055664F
MKSLREQVVIARAKYEGAQEAFDNRTGRNPELGRRLNKARADYLSLKAELDG